MSVDANNNQGKTCPSCGKVSPASEKFCTECGAALPAEKICPSCGKVVPPGNMFCNSCGTPVDQPSPPPVSSVPPPPPPPPPPAYSMPQTVAPAPGGKNKLILPAVIAVIIIVIIAVVFLVGIPGMTGKGTRTVTPTPTMTTTPVTAAPTTSATWTSSSGSTTSTTPVKAAFSASPTSGSVPLTVSFTDSSTGSPSAYYWAFGDGSTSTTKNPTHTFTTAGTYTVKVTVEKNGSTSSKSMTISVGSQPLKADFTVDRTSGTAPLTVSFTDTSTGSPDSYYWDFGNGQLSYDRNPGYVYTSAGSYTVVLRIEKNGIQSTKNAIIYVSAPQVVITTTPATPVSTFSGTFAGYWRATVGSGTEYFWFNQPVGNIIDGTIGSPDFIYGSFTGTLSNGGKTVNANYIDESLGVEGTFTFTLTDANHFTGTLIDTGVSYPVSGYSEPI